MSTGVELATAWVRLVPSVEGVTDSVTKAFIPGQKAAEDAGSKAGAGWSSKLKGALGAAAIVGAVVGTFKGLYEIGSVFADVTDTIRIGTGAQGDALEGLVDVAKNVGRNVPAEFDKISATVADLNTRLGLSGDTLETVASQYLEAGRMLGEDIDIRSTSSAFSAFRIEGEAVVGAMDTLFQVSQATGVGFNELASKTASAAPLVQNLGFTFEDTAALIGTLDKAGLDANKMLATLGPGLVKMSKDGEQPADVFPRVVGELEELVAAGDTASAINLAGGIFGTRGASQFVAAIQSGTLNMDDLMGSLGATEDTILGVGEETLRFGDQWQIFKNRALTALEPVGSAIFNGLGAAMAWINDLFDGMDLGAVFGPMLSSVGELAPLVLDLWTSLSPVSLAFQALQPVLPLLADLLGQVAGVASELAAAILPPLSSILDVVVGVVVELMAAFAPLISALVEALAPILGVVAQIAKAVLVPALNIVSGVVRVLADVITWLVKNVIRPYFTNIVIPVVKSVAEGFEAAFSGLGDFFAGIWNGIKGGFKAFINFLVDGINGFIGGFNSVGGFLSDITGGAVNFTIPRLPRLAEGATILPRRGGTAAILAEAGKPESVVDTGLMNRALEEGLNSPGGVDDGDRLYLVLADGTQLDVYVRRQADVVASSKFPSDVQAAAEFAGRR